MLLLFISVTVACILYYIFDYYRWVAKYPKGPTPWPLIGNRGLNRNRLFDDIRRFSKEYGNVFTIFVPKPMVIVTDYETVREAFVTRGDDFIGRPSNQIDDRISFGKNGGVIRSNGDVWKEQRRTAISILRDFGMGKNLMEEQVKASIGEYLKYLEKMEDKETGVDLRWPIQIMVSNIINETLFGFRYDYDDCQELMDYVEAFNNFLIDSSKSKLRLLVMMCPWIYKIPIIGHYALGQFINKFLECNNFIVRRVQGASESYSADTEPGCFVQAYLQRMSREKNEHSSLCLRQLHATCADFFLAGQETTSNTLRWAMLFLAKHQDVQDKLRAEILSVVGSDRLPSMADRPRMPYTVATALEVQRMANIIPMSVMHSAVVDTEIQGFKIPAGTMIDGDIHQILAHDPIFENPKEFRPERFILDDGKTLNKEAVAHCIPFGIGRRQCAGESLARVELFLGLTSTIQRYRVLPGTQEPDLSGIAAGLILPKPNKLKLLPVA